MGEVWLICDVDTEFDYLRPGYQGDWRKDNPGLTKGVPEFLEFFQQRGIRATFHVQEQSDPDFSIFLRYPEVYQAIREYGQEISLHAHVKEEDYQTRKREIGAGFQRLKDNGYQVTSFRAGWYFTNENTIRVLEELGIKYDCSPQKNTAIGPMNFYRIPNSPYHPSYKDITRVGEAKLLMIPITDSRLGIEINRNEAYELELMKRGVQALIKISQEIEEPVIIYFTTHSWKPIEVNTSAFREWEKVRRERFFDFVLQFPVKSLTVQDAGSRWEKEGYKPYWLKLPDLWKNHIPVYGLDHHFWLAKRLIPKIQRLRYKKSGGF